MQTELRMCLRLKITNTRYVDLLAYTQRLRLLSNTFKRIRLNHVSHLAFRYAMYFNRTSERFYDSAIPCFVTQFQKYNNQCNVERQKEGHTC